MYYFFIKHGENSSDPWKMIPDTPAFVVQTDNLGTLYKKLSEDNEIFKSLKGIQQIQNLDRKMQQFLKIFSNQPELNRDVLHSPFYFADFYDPLTKQNQPLFLFQPQSPPKLKWLKNYLGPKLAPRTTIVYEKVASHRILKFIDGRDNQTYQLAIMDGIVLFTPSAKLLQQALKSYSKKRGHFSQSRAFENVAKTSGKIVDARIYINYPKLALMLGKIVNPGYQTDLQYIARFAQWTEVDLLLKSKEILLSGYTFSGKHNLLSQFNRQNSVNANAYSLYPFNTNLSLCKSYTDFSKVVSIKLLSRFKLAYQTDIKELIHLSKEVCFVSNAMYPNELPNKSWAIIRFNDVFKAEHLLKSLGFKSKSYRTIKYSNHLIRSINIPDFLPRIYGKIFSGIQKNYYILLNGYVVFANTPDALIRLIHYYDMGKTLNLNDNFRLFSNDLVTSSNLTFQLHLRGFLNMTPKYLDRKTSQQVIKDKSILDNFQYMTLQFSHEDSLYYTNFVLEYNKAYKEENLALWKIRLDNPIVGKPYLVKGNRNNKYDIIVFDRGKHMYFINYNGKILWTKKLPGLPISRVYQVDYYKNGKTQYLFNTAHNIFLIDRKGHFVANYPIRIRPAATNGLSLFDYTNRGDYRILLAQADKKIHDFTIKGSPVKGWTYPRMPDIVTQRIYRLIYNHKDYIIITDINNNVKIVSRRGKQRIYLQTRFKKAKNSAYYVNRTNNKGIFLTTDTKGQLVYISESGKITYTSFGEFSPDHYFLYDDFNGNLSKDFIYIDHKKLTVFNRDKKVLFSYTFPSNIDVQPELFSLGSRQKVLGVVASHEKTIYLFGKHGNILIGRGLTGETPFTVGNLNSSGDINLITAAGNTLYNYRIR